MLEAGRPDSKTMKSVVFIVEIFVARKIVFSVLQYPRRPLGNGVDSSRWFLYGHILRGAKVWSLYTW